MHSASHFPNLTYVGPGCGRPIPICPVSLSGYRAGRCSYFSAARDRLSHDGANPKTLLQVLVCSASAERMWGEGGEETIDSEHSSIRIAVACFVTNAVEFLAGSFLEVDNIVGYNYSGRSAPQKISYHKKHNRSIGIL